MGFDDVLLLVWGVAVLFVPGATVVLALRRGVRLTAVAAAPAISVGIFYVASVVGGFLGIGYGFPLVLVTWAACLAVAVLLGRRGPRMPLLPAGRPSPMQVVGLGATVVAVVLGAVTWLLGLGGLDTLPQEHDVIVHSQLVARILMTGEGAPWQSLPGDLLTGEPRGFYPNGFHLYAALLGVLGADPVVALNVAMVLMLGVALPLGVAVLGLRLRPAAWAPLIGGCAALLSVAAYRPMFALMHDGGILSNAAAFAVAPGAVALLLVADRLGLPGVLPIALLVSGSLLLHPNAAVTIGLTAGVWLLLTAVRRPFDRVRARTLAVVLIAGAVVGGLVLIPFLLAGAGITTVSQPSVVGWPRAFPVQSFRSSLRLTFGAPYGGFFDFGQERAQVWIAVLALAGVAVCVLRRANAGLVGAFAVWAALLMAYLMDVDVAPLQTIYSLYYQAYVRLIGGLAPLQWLAGGVAVAAVAEALASVARRVPAARRVRATPAILAALGTAGLLVVVCIPYARVNVQALAERHSDPTIQRVDQFDLQAAAFVAERIRPGQRVMNNANDGSSYGYVFYGLPIVANTALGLGTVPYTSELLQGFNRLDEDDEIRELVCELDIAWAIVDDTAPPIGARGRPWVPRGVFTTAPGLKRLGRTDHLERAARFGDVTVWRVDREGLGCPGGASD